MVGTRANPHFFRRQNFFWTLHTM